MIKHKGTIALQTERLELRRFRETDAEAMFNNWANDNEVTRYLPWRSHGNIEVSKEVLTAWINWYEKGDFYNWGIVLKEEEKLVGSISVVDISKISSRCEIAYCIGREFWNRGIATEALNTIIRFLIQEVGFNRIQALHHSGNPASGRAMLKAGMKYEGRLREYFANNEGTLVDCDIYGILKADLI